MASRTVTWHILDNDGTILVTKAGCGWITVPRAVWEAFTAAVKRGDYDTAGRR